MNQEKGKKTESSSAESDRQSIQYHVYGIGNPLIDIVSQAKDEDLSQLDINKGIMHLIDLPRRRKILQHLAGRGVVHSCGGSAPNTMIASHGVTSRIGMGDGSTGSSIILVTPDYERSMNTYLGMCREYERSDVDEELVRQSRFLYFPGYMWDTEKQKDAVLHAVSVAEEAGCTVVFDAADPFAVERNREVFLELIENHASVVFANRRETELLFGTSDPEDGVSRLAEICDVAAVKIGKDGSLVRGRELSHTAAEAAGKPDAGSRETTKTIRIPAHPAEVSDTTGAAAMYAAGFLYGLATGMGLEASAKVAGYMAARIIERTGAQFDAEQMQAIRDAVEAGDWEI
mgnify:CR=1 FL=1